MFIKCIIFWEGRKSYEAKKLAILGCILVDLFFFKDVWNYFLKYTTEMWYFQLPVYVMGTETGRDITVLQIRG